MNPFNTTSNAYIRLPHFRVRVLIILLCTTALAIALATLRASAAPLGLTFVVNSNGDNPDTNPGDEICHTSAGHCTLRAAIEESAEDPGTDAIQFHIGTGIKTIKPNSQLPTIT